MQNLTPTQASHLQEQGEALHEDLKRHNAEMRELTERTRPLPRDESNPLGIRAEPCGFLPE